MKILADQTLYARSLGEAVTASAAANGGAVVDANNPVANLWSDADALRGLALDSYFRVQWIPAGAGTYTTDRFTFELQYASAKTARYIGLFGMLDEGADFLGLGGVVGSINRIQCYYWNGAAYQITGFSQTREGTPTGGQYEYGLPTIWCDMGQEYTSTRFRVRMDCVTGCDGDVGIRVGYMGVYRELHSFGYRADTEFGAVDLAQRTTVESGGEAVVDRPGYRVFGFRTDLLDSETVDFLEQLRDFHQRPNLFGVTNRDIINPAVYPFLAAYHDERADGTVQGRKNIARASCPILVNRGISLQDGNGIGYRPNAAYTFREWR